MSQNDNDAVLRAKIDEALEAFTPGTLEYAEAYHSVITEKKADETVAEKHRREYYAGVDDDGLPSD